MFQQSTIIQASFKEHLFQKSYNCHWLWTTNSYDENFQYCKTTFEFVKETTNTKYFKQLGQNFQQIWEEVNVSSK